MPLKPSVAPQYGARGKINQEGIQKVEGKMRNAMLTLIAVFLVTLIVLLARAIYAVIVYSP